MTDTPRTSTCWLTTERLGLRRFGPDDLDWLAGLHADDEVARHIGGTKTRAQCAEMLQHRCIDYYEAHPGLGVWATIDRSTGMPVGFHLLNHIQGEALIQVGFVLARTAWGRGLGTEMAYAVLRYGFADLRLPRIVAIATLTNVASQRVLIKIGLRRNGARAFPHPAYAAAGPMAWFERERDAWLADLVD
jgi:ribosomal-protein-alanine N-acetyltransferase